MRVLGIDFGERRIGLALSDPTGTLASPLETVVRRAGKRLPLSKMEEASRNHDVVHLVVGLPLDLQGRETPWCEEVRRMGDALAARLDLPVDYIDERMTSVQAQRALRSIGLSKTQRRDKGRVDAAAAAIILQSWLDRRPR